MYANRISIWKSLLFNNMFCTTYQNMQHMHSHTLRRKRKQ